MTDTKENTFHTKAVVAEIDHIKKMYWESIEMLKKEQEKVLREYTEKLLERKNENELKNVE